MAPKLLANGRVAEKHRFLGFLVTGGLAALANIGSRVVLSQWMAYEAAVILAYLVGMTTAFLLSKRFVFEASGRGAASEYGRFALVNVVALIQVWIVSVGLARFVFPFLSLTWHAETLAHVIGVLSPVATSYYGHKRFTFASRAEP
jgi:putative flippase GtrA